jgi:hypothetical protein
MPEPFVATRHRMPPLAAAVAALACVAILTTGPAAAEPPPGPVEPLPPGPVGLIPPIASIGSVLAQTGSESAGPFGLPDLSAWAPSLLLGQNPVPAPPGRQPGPAGIPGLSAFDPRYLLPLNEAPAAPGEGSLSAGIAPATDDPGTGRIAFLRRLYEMYRAGDLTGAMLGQLPTDEAGRPVLPAG